MQPFSGLIEAPFQLLIDALGNRLFDRRRDRSQLIEIRGLLCLRAFGTSGQPLQEMPEFVQIYRLDEMRDESRRQ
jgi:hypothetical protein